MINVEPGLNWGFKWLLCCISDRILSRRFFGPFLIKDWILHTYTHSDTGRDGTARGVTHYNWFFYKYLGSATLSWFRYFTLLVCCEHLSRNLLNSYCAAPRVFSILWICSYAITYLSLFTAELRDAWGALYSAADDSFWWFLMSACMRKPSCFIWENLNCYNWFGKSWKPWQLSYG